MKNVYENIYVYIKNRHHPTQEFLVKAQPLKGNLGRKTNDIDAAEKRRVLRILRRKLSQTAVAEHDAPTLR